MSDRSLGAVMLIGGIIVIVVYLAALFGGFGSIGWFWAITIVALVAVGGICAVVMWIGYTLLTTPAPIPPTVEPEKAKETQMPESSG